jgi:hypothetical protein
MNPLLPQDVRDAADTCAIVQRVLTERECRDLGRWARMRECFHPDSVVRISWFHGSGPDFVERSIDMARREVRATHRLGPVAVRLNGDRAVASLAATIDIPGTLGDVGVCLSSHARFLYRVERRDGVWRLSSFEAFYLRDELHPQLPGQAVPVTPEDVAGFRPSYRMLSLLLTRQGYAVNHELPGIDRPETVDAMCREVYGWAGLVP